MTMLAIVWVLGLLLAAAVVAVEHPLLREVRAVNRALIASGWHGLSPWWLATFARFVLSGCRQLVIRAGRRAGKSVSLCVFAVAFALAYDTGLIPPGDIGIVAFVSTRQDEAAQRLRTIKWILGVLGIAWTPFEGGIELVGRAIAFRVFPCTVQGVSGFTSILVICDEVAKWRNADGSANPAAEVLAAIRPTTATQKSALLILSSSVFGDVDAHAKAFDEGDTPFQCTAAAKTWEANPSVTEADTYALEPDEATRLREYANVPHSGSVRAIDPDGLRACIRPLAGVRWRTPSIVIDSQGGKNDGFVIAVLAYAEHEQPRASYLVLRDMVTIEGDATRSMTTHEVADVIEALAKRYGAIDVHGDQYGAWNWSSDLRKRALRFHEHAWTSPSKNDAMLRLRQLVRERKLVILPSLGSEAEAIVDEGRTFVERVLPSGVLGFGGRGKSKDDRITTLLLAARIDADGVFSGSPLGRMTIVEALNLAPSANHMARNLGLKIEDMADGADLLRRFGR
jgi:hypothetical protein